MKKQRDLNHGHLGNGITVYDRNVEEHGDYKKIAHINTDRVIEWYIKRITEHDMNYVENIALYDDPCVSATQDTKVFNTRPVKR